MLSGGGARLVVETEGVRFESLHLPQGSLVNGGSLTMAKCTSTGQDIYVEEGVSSVMEDSRVFGGEDSLGGGGNGVHCQGNMKATRCIIEENKGDGVCIQGQEASAELVDCVIRTNESNGLVAVREAKVALRGGTVSGNKRDGAIASGNGEITVSKEKPTISAGNQRQDWVVETRGVLEGVAEEKITCGPAPF